MKPIVSPPGSMRIFNSPSTAPTGWHRLIFKDQRAGGNRKIRFKLLILIFSLPPKVQTMKMSCKNYFEEKDGYKKDIVP